MKLFSRAPGISNWSIEDGAAGVPVPTYAIEDQTAIRVADGAVETSRRELEAVYRRPESKLIAFRSWALGWASVPE